MTKTNYKNTYSYEMGIKDEDRWEYLSTLIDKLFFTVNYEEIPGKILALQELTEIERIVMAAWIGHTEGTYAERRRVYNRFMKKSEKKMLTIGEEEDDDEDGEKLSIQAKKLKQAGTENLYQ